MNDLSNKTLTLAVSNALYVISADIKARQKDQPMYVRKALQEMGEFVEGCRSEIRVQRAMLGPLGPKEKPEQWDNAATKIRFFPMWLISDVLNVLSIEDFLAAEYDYLSREDVAAVRRELLALIENSTDA